MPVTSTWAIPFYLGLPVLIWLAGYGIGKMDGRSEGRREGRANVCIKGETRPCVYGPGIMGIQTCDMWRSWEDTKCEPDPAYRIPPKGSAP